MTKLASHKVTDSGPGIPDIDAPAPEDLVAATTLVRCRELTFDELELAFAGVGSRSVSPVTMVG